ncbi:hypothetical protein IC762_02950 [Bradyrhizobium genosp. L]|uniref:hypothetical protein n=1 Tax=Bradyrhizobium genosp. L TaxID=83637 RepID=UPI0018A2A93C|nr:hypothetical protein [Bradyrhizobium genosp. L]QPF85308.1 hypothetical protein IC762_02950 [Bradyrhizobium genosp. L]
MVGFPLLLIPLAVYNIIVFLMPSLSFTDPLVTVTLMSGTPWAVTLNDVLLAIGVLLLLLEVIKSGRPGAKYLMDHLLSLIVFGAAAPEFVMWSKFGNSTYCLLVLLALVDFISGIALRTRRRALAVRGNQFEPAPEVAQPAPAPAAHVPAAPAPTPVAAPAPAAPAPAAPIYPTIEMPAVEPAPKPVPPAVASPDLQPGSQPSSDTPPR